ncbi:MAG: response regulator transcription factor [Thermoanaerobaculia bacterium]|nr:response regulator transcription factor [Thermoanaerobaculia bacterium]
MKPLSILVVDDDDGIRRSLESELRAAGYATTTAADGDDGVRQFRGDPPDLILTDLSMPTADGFHLIGQIRKNSRVPIIVLSVRGGESDKIRALDLGADDFVVKPFSVAELLARVRAQLRRTVSAEPLVLEFPGLSIDFERRRIVQGDREIRLTPTEYALLELLARNAGKPVTTDEIISRVWSGAPGTTNDTVRVHMGSLRRKIEPDPSSPQYIVTEPWIGFRFIAEPLR